MFRFTAWTSTLALLAAPVMADGHASTMGYALSGDSTSLMVMDSIATPDQVRSITLSTPVRSIAWRPVTRELVGFADGMIVTINPMTGETMDQSATFTDDAIIADGSVVAFDFNNKIDAVRAVGSTGENLVYFPSDFGDKRANSVRRFTDLFYAKGDMSEGVEPLIFANAYTNAINGAKAGGTFQYALDARANALVSLANNAGTLESIGLITIGGEPADVLPVGGFDIVSPEEGADAAYAVLQIDGQDTAGLYAIDVTSGAATLLADLGTSDVSSFAVSTGM
ncbi:hypothetical protein TM1040_3780 (plasmid) [Ruegeria sp. TM1040]|uniref:DUF4394 domain-containing protein n=1 Tax=Ruegeria sp. (strain TM1040) TaxID=292414 RepID=UPI0000554041|nr:DUF4394 domain-containing protein [Ruegeria sp. TM1040]ABF61913.1 hypothetical protein TM1040_3780 [Ruegeria sp. TM1040]